MRKFLIACLLFLATPVLADFPALFDVHGVAADDVLNLRQAPSADSTIVGSLQANDKSIEVLRLSEDRRWAMVNFGEGTAWASAKFLNKSSRMDLVPQVMRCFGTEPFWDLRVSWPGSRAVVDFSREGKPDQSYSVHRADGLNGRSVMSAGPAENNDVHLLVAVKPQYCSDGMSDREFGLGIELFFQDQGNWQNYMGCCSLAP